MSAPDRPQRTDPAAFADFATQLVPEALTDVCGVDPVIAADAGRDIWIRGCALALATPADRARLTAPFYEQTFRHDPAEASAELLAAVAVAVRNSALEPLHVAGLVNSGGITGLTASAAAPLSHLLSVARSGTLPDSAADPDIVGAATELLNQWLDLRTRTPRAWEAFTGLADLIRAGGGRTSTRRHSTPVPDLIADFTATTTDSGAVITDAMDPRFDTDTVARLSAATDGRVLCIVNLSRLSRNLLKLAAAVEYLLARDTPVLTTNYLLRPEDVWIRRTLVAAADDGQSLTSDLTGLSGAHRKLYVQVRASMSGN